MRLERVFFFFYFVFFFFLFIFVFFFQAEDGIRVHCVTGVQTCALPIYDKEADGQLLQALEYTRGSECTYRAYQGGRA